MKPLRTGVTLATVIVTAGGLLAGGAPAAHAAGSGVWADFNGDGYRDVVLHGETLTVAYGGASGIGADRVQSVAVPEGGYDFGRTAAIGNLNGDGYADLVTSDPYGTGMLYLYRGGPKGLGAAVALKQPAGVVADDIGASLTIADFDADGKRDIAVASYHWSDPSAAEVWIYPGGTTARAVSIPLSYNGSPAKITAGDITGDGISDLVVQALAQHDADGVTNTVWYRGGKGGLSASPGALPGGESAAIGDIDRDGYRDIAIGRRSPVSTGGKVIVVYGAPGGPGTGRANRTISQDTPGVPGAVEPLDDFGATVAIGDVDGDGYRDLAIGAPREDLAGVADAGLVTVLRGTSSGISTSGARAFEQNTAGVPGGNERQDTFGADVGLSDVTGDGRAELLVMAPGEDPAGAVTQLRGSAAGTTTASAVQLDAANQDTPFWYLTS